jgi:gentisate 1,2-dioxygenase
MTSSSETISIDSYLEDVQGLHLHPVFLTQPGFMPAEPRSVIEVYNWRWSDVRPRMLAAGDILPVGASGADRRVLNLINPGIRTGLGTTHTLTASIQLVLPGEVAPAHRHTPGAIRFIIEGSGAFTTVDGEQCTLEPGDLVLTPNWRWHDHHSEGDTAVIWLDGLDLPLVRSLEAIFYEEHPDREQAVTRGRDESLRTYGSGIVRPSWATSSDADSPLCSYKAEEVRSALERLSSHPGDPWDAIKLVYTNPVTGGPVLSTISCAMQMVRAGESTYFRRHTVSSIYHVVSGKGHSMIGGQRVDWEAHDTFVVPTWSWHQHASDPVEPAVLFSLSDEPTMRALNLYREEHLGEGVAP